MICYKDKTFCPFHENCVKGAICPNALTDEIRKGAVEWMGDDAQIAQYMSVPSCFEPKTK